MTLHDFLFTLGDVRLSTSHLSASCHLAKDVFRPRTAVTEEEFRRSANAARETIAAFLSNMPPNATVAEVLRAIADEQPDDSELEAAYRRFVENEAVTIRQLN